MSRRTKWIILLVTVAAAMACALVVIGVVAGVRAMERHLPSCAEVIEERRGNRGPQGDDYSYCARFRLKAADLADLRRKGFAWFPGIGAVPSNAIWTEGRLDRPVLDRIAKLDVHLKEGPSKDARCVWLYEWRDGVLWRLIAIDEEKGEVCYYRVTW